MKLAILHYHLAAGGVTRVIANHLRSIDESGTVDGVLLIHDGNRSGFPEASFSFPVRHAALAEMAYRESAEIDSGLADAIERELLDAGFGKTETVLHVHNHSLGKTTTVAAALSTLLDRGWSVLYQIHDFAEDFRPSGYARMREAFGDRFGPTVYPQQPGAHYATLTSGDAAVLRGAGVATERLHLLPNPVLTGDRPETNDQRTTARQRMADVLNVPLDASYWVYPVRGIRRKNLGEACLIAAAMRDTGVVVGVTLTPENPRERPQHDRWTEVAESLGLPIRFGTGDRGRLTFAENLAAADSILTTSISEGFGMVFLESWLNGLPLVGRDLPDVTADFKNVGVDLSMLSPVRLVRLEWFDFDGLAERYRVAYGDLHRQYRQPLLGFDAFRATFVDPITQAGNIDFGRLDEIAQREVIQTVVDDPAAAATVRDGVIVVDDANLIAGNANVVQEQFGAIASGRRLRTVYEAVLSTPSVSADHPIDADAILTAPTHGKLSLAKFRLLRT